MFFWSKSEAVDIFLVRIIEMSIFQGKLSGVLQSLNGYISAPNYVRTIKFIYSKSLEGPLANDMWNINIWPSFCSKKYNFEVLFRI